MQKSNLDNMLLLNSFHDKFNDKLNIVLKDVETGEKYIKTEEEPEIPVYVVKDDEDVPDYFMEYRKEEELKKKMVSYNWREYDLARMLPDYEFDKFVQDIRDGNLEREQIYLDKRLFGADLNINDRIIMDYLDSFAEEDEEGNTEYPDNPPIKNLHIGYFDLEWDVKGSNDIFDPANEIYLMTYVDAKTNECFTYYLKNNEFNRQDEIIDNSIGFTDDMKKELDEDFSNLNIDGKQEEQVKEIIFERLDEMKYNIKGFENEKDMIKEFYNLIIQKKKPDFLYAYNTEADITQTQNRAEVLGIDQNELFTHDELDDFFYFNTYDDTFNPADRRHNYECSSYTKIMDMNITYYAIRGNKNFTEWSLAATAEREIGVGKLDYSHICSHIQDLPYEDFVVATRYNIRDVLVMPFLEDAIQDTKTLLTKKFITRTDYDRLFVSTPTVMNVFYHIGERNGKILSNEINRHLLNLSDTELENLKKRDRTTYDIVMAIKDGDKISGGLCTDPNKVKKEGQRLFDSLQNKKLFDTVIDADASSMYPNNIITANISKSTLIGKVTRINGLHNRVIKNMAGDGNIMEITDDEWSTIKSKKSDDRQFKEKYDAVEFVGYLETSRGDLYVYIDEILEETYDISFHELLGRTKGDRVDRDKLKELKPDGITNKEHDKYYRVLQMYIKKITKKIGEMSVLSMIQRDLVSIGNIFFNLPNLLELEKTLNDNYQQKSIGRTKEIKSKEKTQQLFEKSRETKEIVQILCKLDKVSLDNKDTDTGIYNTNGLFLLDTKPKSRFRVHGRVIEYYLESRTPLADIFNLDSKAYVDRNGNQSQHIYKEQTKPHTLPSLSDENKVYDGKIDEKSIKKLKQTDLLMRRLDFDGIKINLTPRTIPALKKIDNVGVEIYEVPEHKDDVYDVKLTSKIDVKNPKKDTMIINTYMRVLDY